MNRGMILLGIALLAPALYAADGAKGPRSVAELKGFYQARCALCHGEDGSARAANGKELRGFDFTNTKAMQRETDDELAKTIRKGIFFGLAMPAYKADLTNVEIMTLVKEVLRKAAKGQKIEGKAP